jgi:hypothetical protein
MSANGITISEVACTGALNLPASGAWTLDAHVHVSSDDMVPSGAITIDVYGRSFSGTVTRKDLVSTGAAVRVVGGKGKLESHLKAPKAYRNVSAKTILTEILSAVGESMGTCDAHQIADWSLDAGRPACSLLTDLANHCGMQWSVEDGGAISMRRPTWAEQAIADTLVEGESITTGVSVLHVDTTVIGSIKAGVKVAGRKIHLARVISVDTGERVELWSYGDEAEAPAWLTASRREASSARMWCSLYPATVLAQNADYTVDLQLPAPVPQLSRVPIAWGIPGVRAKVTPGTKCAVSFGGSQSTPRVVLWEPATVTELRIDAQSVLVGDGASQSAVLGEKLTDLLFQFLQNINSHTHTAAGSATGTNNTPLMVAMGSILSASVKVAQ